HQFELKTIQKLIKLGFKKVDAFTGAGKECIHLGIESTSWPLSYNGERSPLSVIDVPEGLVLFCVRKDLFDRKITYTHCEMTHRCTKHYKNVAIGIIIAPSMSAFTSSAIEVAKMAGELILLLAIDKLRFYILHATINS
ncbi:15238_t:CDS:2, partial [Gigaspora margarita]